MKKNKILSTTLAITLVTGFITPSIAYATELNETLTSSENETPTSSENGVGVLVDPNAKITHFGGPQSRTMTTAKAITYSNSSPTGVNANVAGSTVVQQILNETNDIRKSVGLAPLTLSTSISTVAQNWSQKQASDYTMYHNPSYSTQMPSGWSRASENVAYGYNYKSVTTAWKNSSGHYKNIVNPSHTHIGIGVSYTEYGVPYYTQNFGAYSFNPDLPKPQPVDPGTGGNQPDPGTGGGTGGNQPDPGTGGGTGGNQPDPGTGGNEPRENHRLSGSDRYQTALAILKQYPQKVSTVYVASGQNFPDALSVTGVAGKEGNPVVITPTASMPISLVNAIGAKAPSRIVIIGSPTSVSQNVVNQLKAKLPSVTIQRVQGADRYETGLEVANKLWSGNMDSAYLTTGTNFPDALSAAPAAIKNNGIVLPVHGNTPSSKLLSTLKAKKVKTITIIGGTNNVPVSFEQVLKKQGFQVTRVAGGDRYQTADLMAAKEFSGKQEKIYIASGVNFPDALSIAALAGKSNAPLILTQPNCLTSGTKSYIQKSDVKNLTAVGSSASVSENVLLNLKNC